MKRLIAFLLALLFCMPLVAACKKEELPPAESESVATELTLISGGASPYVIVYSTSAESQMTGAYYGVARLIQKTIEELTGVSLPIVAEDTAPVACEIVVGGASRDATNSSPVAADTYNKGYSLFVMGEKIIFEAGSEEGLKLAAYEFLDTLLGVDLLSGTEAGVREGQTEFTLPRDYSATETFHSEEFPYIGISISDVSVCYGDDYHQRRAAVILRQELKSIEKIMPPLVDRSNAKEGDAYFWFEKNESLKEGTFRIDVEGKRIILSARDYYGYYSAVRAVMKLRKNLGFYPFGEAKPNEGTHIEYLKSNEASARYAYNNSSEYRIMSYNVYWRSKCEPERAILQTEVIRQYQPDVVGFQEFRENRRTDMVPLLNEMGYAETMDYKKGNFVVGSSGTTKTSLYNYAPIFYNTATTDCIESGFYRYKNQESESESASKTLCWGLMESKETGERYWVVNTHMCTHGDPVKEAQAKEAVKVIDELIAKHNVPVLLIGDYNGRYNSGNYTYFVEQGGMTDIEKGGLATEYTSKLKSFHRPYADYDAELDLMWPAADDDTCEDPSSSVDHIMLKNASAVSVSVYGIVSDDYTMSGSDHYPVFADFSIN